VKLSILHSSFLVSLTALTALTSLACSSDPATNDPIGSPTGGATTTSTAMTTSTTGGGPVGCDPTPIIQESCSGIICHGQPGKPAMHSTDLLNPPSGQSLAQVLMDKPANYNLIADMTSCPTATPELLINSAAPAESLILKKIMGTQACGVKMPNVTGGDLTQAEIDCFVSWVNASTGHDPGPVTTASTGTTGTTGAATTGTASTSSGSTGTTGAATTTGTTGATTGTTGATTGAATTTGTTGGAVVPGPNFETMVVVATQNPLNCSSSDCHGGFEGRLDLREATLYESVTSWSSEVCGKPVISPGDPDGSALIQVLTTGCGNVTPDCMIGTECIPRMPLECVDGVDCIPPEYIDALRQWITNGAPRE